MTARHLASFPVLACLALAWGAPGHAAHTDRHGDSLPEGAVARLGTVRLRHGADVVALAFAPGGKALASACRDGRLSLWDAASGKELHRIPGEPGREIRLLAFSPDGKLLAFTEWSPPRSLVCLCDAASGKVTRRLPAGKGPMNTLAFSPDGRLLAWGGDNEAGHLWDVAAGREADRLDGLGKGVHFLAFTPDAKALVVGTGGDNRGAVLVWDLAARKVRHQFPARPWEVRPWHCALSPDATFLAFQDDQGRFPLRDLASGKEIRRVGQESDGPPCPAVTIYLSPDGKTLAAVGPDCLSGCWEGMVRLWDVATGKEVGRFREPGGDYYCFGCAAFSPDSRVLAVGGTDHAVHLFDLATGKERPRSRGPFGSVSAVAFSPDGKALATASWDGVRLWDAAGRELGRLPAAQEEDRGDVAALAFTADGRRLVAVGRSGAVRVWDVASGRELHRRQGPPGNWWAVGLSPGAGVLALGGAEAPWFVAQDAATGETAWRLNGGGEAVSCLALSPRGRSAAAVVWQGVIHIWDVKAGRLRHRIPGHEPASNGPCAARLAFSPDGRTLASWRSKDGVQLWEVETGRQRLRLRDVPAEALAIAFSPDGRLLACGAEDGSVGLWDVGTGKRLGRARGHRGAVGRLAFSPDGRLLLSGSADTTALLWDVRRLLSPRRPGP